MPQKLSLSCLDNSNVSQSKHVSLIGFQMNIQLAGEHVQACECVRNLDFHMDQSLSFKMFVSKQIQKALSNFSYCDTVYGLCLDTTDQNRIQKV